MPAGWNAVATQVTGYLVTAADWNDGVVYNTRYLKGQSGAIATEDNVAVAGTVTALSPDSGSTGAIKIQAPASANPSYIQFLNNALDTELAHIAVTSAGLMSLGTANCKVDTSGNISPVGNVDGVDVSDHSARHENGGADEISVAGLSGVLADAQNPTSHTNAVHTRMVFGATYNGNGSGATRQITTGFIVKLLILYGVVSDTDTDVAIWISQDTVSSVCMPANGTIVGTIAVKLHATDGFSVGNASNEGNTNLNAYTYAAFG